MMRSLPIILTFTAINAFATPIWVKHFNTTGCGNNAYAAKSKAKVAALKVSDEVAAECLADKGVYTAKLSQGYCNEDTGDIQCRVECAVLGKGTCTY